MDESHKKAQITRQRNQEAQRALYQERAAVTRAARSALQRVLEDANATPAEILEAAKLLMKIGRL